MPQVKRIEQVMESNALQQDGYSLENYKSACQQFQKLYAQAKDFVKFLSTLERQFRNIARGELSVIEETLPSLLTGLKLIWTISRHINQNEHKMEDILESISNEICDKVKAKIDIQNIFRMKPEDAIPIIQKGKVVLDKWRKEFEQTRRDIENEQTVKRWDFQKGKDIFKPPAYMISVLEDLEQACIITQEFYAILGADLKAVTGSSEQIDLENEKVRDQVRKLETFNRDVFSEKHAAAWQTTFDNFKSQIYQIDSHVVALIDKTFSDRLNSSEGAFDLLSKFQNVKTREAIKDLLTIKYDDVLRTYQQELSEMETLFSEGRDNPPISKNMPPKAGSIAWARSIMGRIKAPIKKFKNKADQLMTQTFKDVALSYVKLAKELDMEYEQKIFETWRKENTEKAIDLLKKNILAKKEPKEPGENVVYSVQFDPQLKVIIREAKFLDRIGKSIPQTIVNIALQEKDYMRYVDKLNQLLRCYNSALSHLKPVEKKLLEKQINKLNKWMDKGHDNHNWFSLSINEYIKECQQAIDSFIEIKNRVIQKAQNIEEKVINIENAQIIRQIDFERKTTMDITEFSDYFESYRVKMIASLVKDYQNIGDLYLKHIYESTVKNKGDERKSYKSEEMRPYYMYWERRIFNAISKMIVRALAANKTLWMRTERPSLIRMTSAYIHPGITFHPTQEELKTQLEKFSRNILESTKSFGRWHDGFCTIFSEINNDETNEKYIPYTFFDDVMQNKMISQLHYEIVQSKVQIIEKFTLLVKGWKSKWKLTELFDKNQQTKLQKQIDKQNSTQMIEQLILRFLGMKNSLEMYHNEQQNYFVLIDNSDVKQTAIQKV